MTVLYAQHLTKTLSGVDVAGRWSVGRKSALITLIRRGNLTAEQACTRYGLSTEELASWMASDKAYGARGLSATKLQEVGR